MGINVVIIVCCAMAFAMLLHVPAFQPKRVSLKLRIKEMDFWDLNPVKVRA